MAGADLGHSPNRSLQLPLPARAVGGLRAMKIVIPIAVDRTSGVLPFSAALVVPFHSALDSYGTAMSTGADRGLSLSLRSTAPTA